MAARVDAAARCSTTRSSITKEKRTYTRTEILCLKDYFTRSVPEDFLAFPAEIIRTPGRTVRSARPETRHRRRCERRRERGKRTVVRARLIAAPYKRKTDSPMDTRLDSCVMVITETWMKEGTPEVAVELAGSTIY